MHSFAAVPPGANTTGLAVAAAPSLPPAGEGWRPPPTCPPHQRYMELPIELLLAARTQPSHEPKKTLPVKEPLKKKMMIKNVFSLLFTLFAFGGVFLRGYLWGEKMSIYDK